MRDHNGSPSRWAPVELKDAKLVSHTYLLNRNEVKPKCMLGTAEQAHPSDLGACVLALYGVYGRRATQLALANKTYRAMLGVRLHLEYMDVALLAFLVDSAISKLARSRPATVWIWRGREATFDRA